MQADCLKVAVLLLGNHKEDRSELMTFIYLSFFFKEILCFGSFFTSSLQPREFLHIFLQSHSYVCLKGYQKNAYIAFLSSQMRMDRNSKSPKVDYNAVREYVYECVQCYSVLMFSVSWPSPSS